MSGIGKPESATQSRVIQLFQQALKYCFLGDWIDRVDNSNIEESLLTAYLSKAGYGPAQISAALYKLGSVQQTLPVRQSPRNPDEGTACA